MLQIPFGILPTNGMANIDERYGPYESLQDALEALSGDNNTRAKGLVVGIETDGSVYDYVFRRGIEDHHLVPKDMYMMRFKGTLPDYDALLEVETPEIGDFYVIESEHETEPEFPANSSLAWNGTVWHVLPGMVDISGKLDKVSTVTGGTMVYVKLPGGGQSMMALSSIIGANAIVVDDSDMIDLEGDGTPENPLVAYLNISHIVLNRLLKVNSDGELDESNIKDLSENYGIEIMGKAIAKSFIGESISMGVNGSFSIDLSNPASHYDIMLNENTSISFTNMIDEFKSIVISLVVTGNKTLILPSYIKPMPNNDTYHSPTVNHINLIVILLRMGGGSPKGLYSLQNVNIAGSGSGIGS